MTENTFPVYKVDAIVNFYRTEVLTGQEAKHFSKADLVPHPKAESVRLLYIETLRLVNDLRPECLSVMPLIENTPNPVYHEWTTSILSIFVRMRRFLPLCFVYDFSLNDLLAPKAKKTLYILSGIMNFLHFRKQRADMAIDHQMRFRADMDRLKACTVGMKEAEKKIEMLITIPPEQQAEARELAASISELQAVSREEYQKVNTLKEETFNHKADNSKKTHKLSQLQGTLTTLKEENENLKSHIVDSPEEIKNQMEKMKENVKKIKTATEHADQQLVELQNAVQKGKMNEADAQMMCKMLQDLQSVMDSCEQGKGEINELASTCEKLQKGMKNLYAEEGHLKRAQSMKLDKLSKQKIRRQKKRETKDQCVNDMLGQCNSASQKREDMAEQIKGISQEAQQLKAKMLHLKDVSNKDAERAQNLYDCLSVSLEEFNGMIQTRHIEVNKEFSRMSANLLRA